MKEIYVKNFPFFFSREESIVHNWLVHNLQHKLVGLAGEIEIKEITTLSEFSVSMKKEISPLE